MRAAWLWARADIRARWVSLAVLAVLVAVMVGSVLALVAGSRRANSAFDRYFEAEALPDVLVAAESEDTGRLVEDFASDGRVERVERAEMVVMVPGPMEPSDVAFTVIGTAGSLTGGFGRPALVSGRYPDASASDEIVVNERAAATYGFHPGQWVPLRAIRCFDGCPLEVVGEATIVGVVRLATDLTGDPQVKGVAIGTPALLDGRWRDLPRPVLWFGVHVRNRDDIAAVVAQLSTRVTDGDAADARAATAPLARAGRWQRNGLAIAAAIVAVAGVLVVTQALARHLAGRPKDPGLLAALGVTSRERSAAGLMSVVPAVLGGTAGGVALAVALSPLLPLGVTRRADPDIGLHGDTVALTLGSGAALTLLVAATWLAAVLWARQSREDDMASTPSITARMAANVGLHPVPSTGTRFALAWGQGRSRVPVVPAVLVLATAVSIVAGALVVRWSLDGLVSTPDRYGQSFDLRVSLPADGDGLTTARQLAADPRVRDVSISRQGAVDVVTGSGSTLQVATTAVESLGGAAPLAVLDGRVPAGPREMALASATMEAVGLHVGDRTTVRGPCGEFDVEIVGRVIVPLTGSNYPDDGSILTAGGYDQLCAQANVPSIDVNTSALVRLRDDDDTDAVRHDWQSQGLPVTDPETPNSVQLIRDLRTVPAVVAAVMAVLGFAAAAHALLLTVRRRRHDIAVLRAFGLRPGQAGGVIRWQAATLAFAALLIGMPLGLAIGRLVWAAIAGPSNVVVRTDLRALGLALLVAAVGVLALVAAVWPAHRAAHLRPAESLRSE